MANTTIQLKYSTITGNVPSSLANGEISINNRDGKFFYSTPAGVVVTHYPYLGPAGLNQEIQFNDSGILGSNSNLTFNKSTGYFKAPIIESTNNGNGTNFKVGDDAWIGDINLANTLRIKGQQDSTKGYIVFGDSDGKTLGRSGTGALIYDGFFSANGEISSLQSIGDEGGQINLALAATNTSLSGSVAIDIYQNKLRFFETGGTNRGVYIDMANGTSASVGTNLLAPSSSTDGWARGQANASFAQANSAASYANSAFAAANTGSGGSSAGPYANAAFSKANSAYSAAQAAQSTADSAQSTATAAYNTYDIASIYTPNNATTVSATGRSDTVNFVGESGVVVYANSSTKTITVAGTPGAQGLTVDYGFVADPIYYSIDYGSLA